MPATTPSASGAVCPRRFAAVGAGHARDIRRRQRREPVISIARWGALLQKRKPVPYGPALCLVAGA